MAKKLNKNLVIVLYVFGCIVTTVAGSLMVYQLQKVDPTDLERRAKEAAKAEDWERAVAFYMRAYQNSENTDYLVDAEIGRASCRERV